MKPITINASDDIKTQTIALLEGCLKAQTTYTDNAAREVMRLRSIIATCDKCRAEANAGNEFRNTQTGDEK